MPARSPVLLVVRVIVNVVARVVVVAALAFALSAWRRHLPCGVAVVVVVVVVVVDHVESCLLRGRSRHLVFVLGEWTDDERRATSDERAAPTPTTRNGLVRRKRPCTPARPYPPPRYHQAAARSASHERRCAGAVRRTFSEDLQAAALLVPPIARRRHPVRPRRQPLATDFDNLMTSPRNSNSVARRNRCLREGRTTTPSRRCSASHEATPPRVPVAVRRAGTGQTADLAELRAPLPRPRRQQLLRAGSAVPIDPPSLFGSASRVPRRSRFARSVLQ